MCLHLRHELGSLGRGIASLLRCRTYILRARTFQDLESNPNKNSSHLDQHSSSIVLNNPVYYLNDGICNLSLYRLKDEDEDDVDLRSHRDGTSYSELCWNVCLLPSVPKVPKRSDDAPGHSKRSSKFLA